MRFCLNATAQLISLFKQFYNFRCKWGLHVIAHEVGKNYSSVFQIQSSIKISLISMSRFLKLLKNNGLRKIGSII